MWPSLKVARVAALGIIAGRHSGGKVNVVVRLGDCAPE